MTPHALPDDLDARAGEHSRADAPVLLLAAMADESIPLLARLEDPREVATPFPGATRPVTAASGRIAGRPVVVLTSGIGMVAASLATTWGVMTQHPRAVISAGSAGGLARDVDVETLVLGTSFAYSIADATAFGYAPGQVPGQPERFTASAGLADVARRALPGVREGLALSGDAFVTEPLAAPMRERFPGAITADMESTAIAQACAALGVPMLSLRAVSDLCGPAADQQFHAEIDVVAEISAAAIERVLRAM